MHFRQNAISCPFQITDCWFKRHTKKKLRKKEWKQIDKWQRTASTYILYDVRYTMSIEFQMLLLCECVLNELNRAMGPSSKMNEVHLQRYYKRFSGCSIFLLLSSNRKQRTIHVYIIIVVYLMRMCAHNLTQFFRPLCKILSLFNHLIFSLALR